MVIIKLQVYTYIINVYKDIKTSTGYESVSFDLSWHITKFIFLYNEVKDI